MGTKWAPIGLLTRDPEGNGPGPIWAFNTGPIWEPYGPHLGKISFAHMGPVRIPRPKTGGIQAGCPYGPHMVAHYGPRLGPRWWC